MASSILYRLHSLACKHDMMNHNARIVRGKKTEIGAATRDSLIATGDNFGTDVSKEVIVFNKHERAQQRIEKDETDFKTRNCVDDWRKPKLGVRHRSQREKGASGKTGDAERKFKFSAADIGRESTQVQFTNNKSLHPSDSEDSSGGETTETESGDEMRMPKKPRIAQKRRELNKPRKKFGYERINPVPHNIASDIQLVRAVEGKMEALRHEEPTNRNATEDWNKTAKTGGELSVGTSPRRLRDIKSVGVRKIYDRAMKKIDNFMKMTCEPDNGEVDRPLFAVGMIIIDQIQPNPSNNPGRNENMSYEKNFQPTKIILQAPSNYSARIITETLQLTANNQWVPLEESEHTSSMKCISTDIEQTYKLLYGERVCIDDEKSNTSDESPVGVIGRSIKDPVSKKRKMI